MNTPKQQSGKWGDLAPRFASAIVMVIVGAAALWAGGVWFNGMVLVIVGLMLWELLRMSAPEKPAAAVQSGLLGVGALAALLVVPVVFVLPVLIAAVLVIAGASAASKSWVVPFSLAILLAGLSLIELRSNAGLTWVLWLFGIVVATDIAGYLAGRLIGGPKFWPRFSPKKTWSGTVAGWVCAGLISWWFTVEYELPSLMILGGILMSFASQMGDIAESALKRATGVKDSSNLIPGHGGVMDRFDGMLAAALLGGLLLLLQGAL